MTDSCGTPAYCEQDIYVNDQTPPELTCPSEIIIIGTTVNSPYSNYNAFIAAGGFAFDECEIDKLSFRRVGTDVSDGNSNPEIITRTYQIADICGNRSQCEQLIYIFSNSAFNVTIPPSSVLQCPGDLPPAYVSYAEFVADGGSVESTTGVIIDEASFMQVGADLIEGNPCSETITRTYSISDATGISTTWEQTITVRDTEKPLLSLGRKAYQCLDDAPPLYSSRQQFESDRRNTASDNCELDWSTLRLSRPPSIDGICPRTIIRYYLINDVCGNVSDEAREIIIINDTQKPDTIRGPRPLFADCDLPLPYLTPAEFNANSGGFVIDNCDMSYVKLTVVKQDTLEFECPKRIRRWYRFTDLCGNFRDVPQIITVNDTLKPVISCPADTEFDASINELEALTGLAFTFGEQQIDLADTASLGISTIDNCELAEITYRDNVVGGCPAVVTRIYTAYDYCGNIGTCSQVISLSRGILITETHVDVGPAVLPIGSIDITVSGGDGPYTYQWSGPDGYTSTDEDIFNLYAGDYTVTVTDTNKCESAITIFVSDEEILTSLDCPPTIEVGCNTEIDIHPPYTSYAEFVAAGGSAESNCGIDTTTFAFISQDTIEGVFCLNLQRTYSIIDSCGNERTCEQLIIVNDTEPPVISCPGNVTTECLSDLNMNIVTIEDFIAAGGTLSDNCGIDSASFTINKVINRLPGQSEIRATFIIKDLCGNTDSCTQILISTDTEPPLASCTDITVYLDEIGKYILNGDDIGRITANSSDNCTNPEDLIIDIDITEFDCEDLADDGVQVKILISDEAGNETECTANITVLDTIPPEAICKDITVYLDENGTAGIITADVDNGSGDNCSLDNMSLSKYQFDCNDVGENEITLTVTDKFGLTKTCTSTVTVIDLIPPVVNCVPPFEVQLDENAQYSLNLDEIHLNSYDECGIDELYLDIYDLDCSHIGTTPVTLTAVDVNGNSSFMPDGNHRLGKYSAGSSARFGHYSQKYPNRNRCGSKRL